MNLIIDRCPFYDEPTEVNTSSGPVLVRAYQIVVSVSISVHGVISRSFPVILDTGHSHNFSIKEEHLRIWAGLNSHEIQTIGHARLNKQLVELKDATVAIHLNAPGKRDELRGQEPYLLTLSEGIAIHRGSDPFAPRLPLLGLRALVKNGLLLSIDGRNLHASLAHA